MGIKLGIRIPAGVRHPFITLLAACAACLLLVNPVLPQTTQKPSNDIAALFTAAEAGDVGTIKKLLAKKVSVDARDPDGMTPLMMAASAGKLQAVQALVQAGANVNAKSAKGGTPLMAGAFSGNAAVVRLLLEHGADRAAVTETGMNAAEIARRRNHVELAKLLEPPGKPAAQAPVSTTAETSRRFDAALGAYEAGRYDEAEKLFQEVLAVDPRHVFAWHFLGQSLAKRGDHAGAAKAYEKVLEIQPTGQVADRTRELLGKAQLLTSKWAPTRPVRLVVPHPSGGSAYPIARAVAQEISGSLGQPVTVDARPGGGGLLGSQVVAQSAPDGHTLLLTLGTTFTVSRHFYPQMPFDPDRSLMPIAQIASAPLVLVTNPSSGFSTPRDFATRGGIFGFSYPGSILHIALEIFRGAVGAGRSTVVPPFAGIAPAITALFGGHINGTFAYTGSVAPHILSGKLSAIAVTGSTRSALLPNVPTFAELGVSGMNFNNWYGVWAPAGTPVEVINRYYAEIAKALQSAKVRDELARFNLESSVLSPSDVARFLREETARFGEVIRAANIQVGQSSSAAPPGSATVTGSAPSAAPKAPNVVVSKSSSGLSTYTWPDGTRYEGESIGGVRTGKGKMSWPNGHRYEGDFVNGRRTGNGTYWWQDGSRYVGTHIDNMFINGQVFNSRGDLVAQYRDGTRVNVTTTPGVAPASPTTSVPSTPSAPPTPSTATTSRSASDQFTRKVFLGTRIDPEGAEGHYPILAANRSAAGRLMSDFIKRTSSASHLYRYEIEECAAGGGPYFAFADSHDINRRSTVAAVSCGEDSPERAAEVAWQKCKDRGGCRRRGGVYIELMVSSRRIEGIEISLGNVKVGNRTHDVTHNIREGWLCVWQNGTRLDVDGSFVRRGGPRRENFSFNCGSFTSR